MPKKVFTISPTHHMNATHGQTWELSEWLRGVLEQISRQYNEKDTDRHAPTVTVIVEVLE